MMGYDHKELPFLTPARWVPASHTRPMSCSVAFTLERRRVSIYSGGGEGCLCPPPICSSGIVVEAEGGLDRRWLGTWVILESIRVNAGGIGTTRDAHVISDHKPTKVSLYLSVGGRLLYWRRDNKEAVNPLCTLSAQYSCWALVTSYLYWILLIQYATLHTTVLMTPMHPNVAIVIHFLTN